MEDYTPVLRLSFQKKKDKKNINLLTNNNNIIIKLHSLIRGKNNIDFDLQTKRFHSQAKKRRKDKFNSIIIFQITVKIYFKKSVFKKQSNSRLNENFNRKIYFLIQKIQKINKL